MTPALSALVLLATAGAKLDERPLQVAIVLDGSAYLEGATGWSLPASLIADLTVFVNVVRKKRPNAQFAVMGCRWSEREPLPNVLIDLGAAGADFALAPVLYGVPAPSAQCGFRTETFSAALEKFAWEPILERHIVLVASSSWGDVPPAGRRTFEEVIHDADHRKFVVHGLNQSADGARDEMRVLRSDVEMFMKRPTWPLGRSMVRLRHGALWTGGSHSVSVAGATGEATTVPEVLFSTREECEEKVLLRRYSHSHGLVRWIISSRRFSEELQAMIDQCHAGRRRWLAAREAADLDALHGPRQSPDQLDALAELALGHRRPSEVENDETPAFLRGVPLEPLLDAIFDFVDARSELESIVQTRAWMEEEETAGIPFAGYMLGKAVLAGARPIPSRR